MKVFDKLSFKVEDFQEKEFNRLISDWVKKEPSAVGNGRYLVDWHNLRINYFPNQKLVKVSNSLHKFYNSEISGLGMCSHDDYTYTKVEETVYLLQEVFNKSSREINLYGRFEYGFNIDTSSLRPFEDIIERCQSIVTTTTNPFYVMYNKNGKPYTKFCSFTHYNVKAYSKNKEMGLTGKNIFRLEIVNHSSNKTKEVFGRQDISLEDLTDKKNMG